MADKYWDDLKVGDKVKSPGVTVTETHLVNWACLTGDWYSLHMDAEYAKKTSFGERLVHGPFIFALAVGLFERSGLTGDSIAAWLGIEKMRMPLPVKIGDTVHAEIAVADKRETSKQERGIATIKIKILNQRDETVMEFEHILLLHRRHQ